MAIRLDINSLIPSPAQWVLIAAFIIGAVALIPQYITLTTVQVGYLSLIGALLTLALKIFTTEPKVVVQP